MLKMSFSGDLAYKFTEKIAIPRLIGTEGWKKAQNLIKDEFKKNGYEIQVQNFKSSMFMVNVLLRVAMIPLLIIIILIIFGYYFYPWVSLILSALILGLVPIIGKYATSGTEYKEPKKGINSQNIFVKLKSETSKAEVVFIGHYDTKSQVLSIVQRVICFVLLFIFGLIACILFFISSIFKLFLLTENSVITISGLVCAIIAGCAAIILMTNAVQNKSPGALDNGTAVATVIELSRVFKDAPPKNIDLMFLCTDAEEQGVLGASAFIQKYEDQFSKENTYFINFEGPGAKDVDLGVLTSFGMPKKQYTSKKLNTLAIQAAESLNINLKKHYWPIGLLADHNPIMKHGFKATMLGSMTISAGIHTPKDTMENVSRENLEKAGRIAQKIIELFDLELNQKD